MITRLNSISGVIISVLASSVVSHDYITPLILFSLVIMIYHTRSQHTNNYTTDASCLVIMIYHTLASSVVNHDYKAEQYQWCNY
jgi:hypothetical protein